MTQRHRKIAVMGHRAVGKSSICLQFVDNHFADGYNPTIENTFNKLVKRRGVEYNVEIVDTAGQDEQELFQAQYAIGVHGYVLVYSCASKASLEVVKDLNDKLLNYHGTDSIARVLVGNKTDLHMEREVPTEDGAKLAQEWGCAFIECSAKQNMNIDKLFGSMIDEMQKAQEPEDPKSGCAVC
eukprot:TRINITY_DN5926_c0_g1_i1.p1 TRINITY_DN5926_c0_g1~~TRINITY_DN5926_c0_g1_i1.p1  ORF type:complete len:183 (+),score=58.82 TRINITY_DN5926_c0_g1_i1:99-647(+)